MKITTLMFAVSLAASGAPSGAQDTAADHSAHHPSVAAAAAATDTTDAEVRKVDKESKTLVLKHGEIKNLDMPDHVTVFQVKDPRMLDTVKTGDKVKFKAEKLGGAYTVTFIERAK